MKVLLISNDLMPFGNLPTSGGGLRAWQLYRGLQTHGFEVIASMPSFTYLAEKHRDDIPAEQREFLWQFGTQGEIVRRVKPDAVLFTSNWDHFALPFDLTVPLIIDLHGPRYLETKLWDQTLDTGRKVAVLARADCLLAAGRRQQLYFSGWLVQGGRIAEEEHLIRYVPIALDPQLPDRDESEQDSFPWFVSGGGWFPWQNQAHALFQIADFVRCRNRGALEIFGGPHARMGNTAEERLVHELYAKTVEISRRNSRVRVNGYLGREDLLRIYSRASMAVELMRYNLERELAFTTRTIEYLWCGLPVIYNDYAEVGEHIAEYDAGWTIPPDRDDALAKVLEEVWDSPAIVRAKGLNAQRLVRDRFTWDRAVSPLVDFLNRPARLPRLELGLAPFFPRPSYMSPRGMAHDVVFGPSRLRATVRAVIPAENTAGVELPLRLHSADARRHIREISLTAFSRRGAVLSRRRVRGAALPLEGALALSFSIFRQPRGGDEVSFALEVVPAEIGVLSPLLTVSALDEAKYPLLHCDEPGALNLVMNFLPGEASSLYGAKLVLRRAWQMVREGEFRRFFGALRRRIPIVRATRVGAWP